MLRFLYDKNYVPEGTELRPPAMLFHVKVYAIADKYDIPALRTAAAVKFYRSCSYGFSEGAEHYVSALRAIYSTTPASDHELRSRALSICKDKRNLNYLLSGESFRNAIPELHELCKELSKAPSSGPYCMEMPDYGEPVYKCRNERCNIIWSGPLINGAGGTTILHCPYCFQPRGDWAEARVGNISGVVKKYLASQWI